MVRVGTALFRTTLKPLGWAAEKRPVMDAVRTSILLVDDHSLSPRRHDAGIRSLDPCRALLTRPTRWLRPWRDWRDQLADPIGVVLLEAWAMPTAAASPRCRRCRRAAPHSIGIITGPRRRCRSRWSPHPPRCLSAVSEARREMIDGSFQRPAGPGSKADCISRRNCSFASEVDFPTWRRRAPHHPPDPAPKDVRDWLLKVASRHLRRPGHQRRDSRSRVSAIFGPMVCSRTHARCAVRNALRAITGLGP